MGEPLGAQGERPIRVLMLATRIPVASGDGTPSFILDGAVALPDSIEVTIVAPRVRGSRPLARYGRVEVRRFGTLPRLSGGLADDAIMPQLAERPHLWWRAAELTLGMLIAGIREHRRLDPDLIHAQWIVPSGLVATMIRAIFGTPYIVTSRGADAFTMTGRGVASLKRLIIRRSSAFLAVSNEILQRFEGLAPRSDHLPSGVDFDAWSSAVGQRSPRHGQVLFVGRLAEKKGVEILLRALSQVEGASLRVAGDGPSRPALEALADHLGIAERVQFLGTCDRERLAQEFRSAACVAIPSVIASDGDREGTPNVFGEAVASGVPVAASASGGIIDIAAHEIHCLLSQPGDAGQLADNLRRLLGDEALREQLAMRARTLIREELEIDTVARRQSHWYSEVLSDR